MVEHVACSKHVAVFHLWNEHRQRVACIGSLQFQALCHDALGDVVEHHAAHAATRSRQTRLLYADDAAIAWLVGWEEACKREQIVHLSALVSGCALRYLRRTRLACYEERLRAGFLAESLTHHVFENGGYLLYRCLLGDALAQHHGFKLLYHHAVLHHRLHKARCHHLSAVGDGVVEGEC